MQQTDREVIGSTLKAARNAKGLTQSEAGAGAGLANTVISRIENGRFTGSLKQFERYIQKMGYSLAVTE